MPFLTSEVYKDKVQFKHCYTGHHDKHKKLASVSVATFRILWQWQLPGLQHCRFLGHLPVSSLHSPYADLKDCVRFLYNKAHWPLFELDLNTEYSEELILCSVLFSLGWIIQIDHTTNILIKRVSDLFLIHCVKQGHNLM